MAGRLPEHVLDLRRSFWSEGVVTEGEAKLTGEYGRREHGSRAIGGVAASLRLDADAQRGPICITEHQHNLLTKIGRAVQHWTGR